MASAWNQLMELVATRNLSPREGRVLAAIARKTLGFNKQQGDRISASQLADLTGMCRSNVQQALGRLERRGILERSDGGPTCGHAAILRINLEPVSEPRQGGGVFRPIQVEGVSLPIQGVYRHRYTQGVKLRRLRLLGRLSLRQKARTSSGWSPA